MTVAEQPLLNPMESPTQPGRQHLDYVSGRYEVLPGGWQALVGVRQAACRATNYGQTSTRHQRLRRRRPDGGSPFGLEIRETAHAQDSSSREHAVSATIPAGSHGKLVRTVGRAPRHGRSVPPGGHLTMRSCLTQQPAGDIGSNLSCPRIRNPLNSMKEEGSSRSSEVAKSHQTGDLCRSLIVKSANKFAHSDTALAPMSRCVSVVEDCVESQVGRERLVLMRMRNSSKSMSQFDNHLTEDFFQRELPGRGTVFDLGKLPILENGGSCQISCVHAHSLSFKAITQVSARLWAA
jgi:hypothetical protein